MLQSPVGEACGMGVPDYDQAVTGVTFTSQAVTPMTEESARYFFCWGPHKAHGDAAMRDMLMGIAGPIFNRIVEKLARDEAIQRTR